MSQISGEPTDHDLVWGSAPPDPGRPWLFLVVIVIGAFVLGAGTGYGIGAAKAPSPSLSPSGTPVQSETALLPTSFPTATAGPNAWPWLEEQLPATLAGTEPNIKQSFIGFGPQYQEATTLASGCSIPLSAVGWATASWGGWSAAVYSVLGCSGSTLLGTYEALLEREGWTSLKIAGKQVEFVGGYWGTWLYARDSMLYVVTGPLFGGFAEPPEIVELFSGLP